MDVKKVISSYARFVPNQFIALLGKEDITQIKLGDQIERTVTILFADIRDFTRLSESMTPHENFEFINSFFSQMEPLIAVNDGIVDKFMGDGIMAIFPYSANDAVKCALQMHKQLRIYNEGRQRAGYVPIQIGIGLNTGIAMLGIVGGYNRMEGTVISDAVNLASRIESMTKNYNVGLLISENTRNNVDEHLKKYMRFVDRVRVKGKLQPQSIYELFAHDNDDLKQRKLNTKNVFETALAHYHYKEISQCEALLKSCVEPFDDDEPAKIYLERCRNFDLNGIHEGAYELTQSLEWNKDFIINEVKIDRQHKTLVENAIRLTHFNHNRLDRASVVANLAEFEKNVTEHFTYEETVMKKVNYPLIEHQVEQHQRFLRTLQLFEGEIKDGHLGDLYLMFRAQTMLVDWLINHTLKEDKHLGRFL